MPRVPSYERFQPSQNNIPHVRAEAPIVRDYNAEQTQEFGQALTRAGLGALDIAHQYDMSRVNDGTNKAMGAMTSLTYDQADGYVNLRGEAALKRPDGRALDDEYATKFKEKLEGIAGELGNDAQRQMFKQQSDQMVAEFKQRVARHMAQEAGTYQVGVHDGTVAVASQRMGLGWNDPATVSQSADAIRAATYDKGKLLGWSPVQTQAATVASLSPAHLSVIQGAVDANQISYAREYLKNTGAEMSTPARESAHKLVEAGDLAVRAQAMSDELFAKHPNDTAAALAEARDKTTGKERDAVEQRLKLRYDEVSALREKSQKEAADTAWKVYAQVHDVNAIPPSILSAMDGRDAEALRKTAQKDADARWLGTQVETDPNVYYALTQAAAYDRNFVNEDLRRYFDKLSPGDRNHFVDLQARIAKKDDTEQVVGVTEQKNAMIKTLNLKGADAGVFSQQADKALYEAQRAKGSVLNQDERQKVLDRLAMPGTVPGSWFGTSSRRAFQAIEEGKPFTPEWSDADKRKMSDAFKRRGINNPTPQQLDAALRKLYGVQ